MQPVRALSESVFSVLQEGHQVNKGLSAWLLLHRNHENGPAEAHVVFINSRIKHVA